jgi:hypothetical protein
MRPCKYELLLLLILTWSLYLSLYLSIYQLINTSHLLTMYPLYATFFHLTLIEQRDSKWPLIQSRP